MLNKINNWLNQELEKLHIGFGIKQTGIFVLSFVISYFATGNPSISLTGALASLLYFLMPDKDIQLKTISKIIVLYSGVFAVALFASIATANIVSSITVNFILPFLLACILIDESNIYGYVYHYIIFTYVQFTEITLDILPMYLISAFIGVVVAYVFYEFIWSNDVKNGHPNKIDYKEFIATRKMLVINKVKECLRFDSSTSRFALRLSIATAVSITLWSYIDLPKWYWIAKATCFTLIPIWSQINYRAANRFKSTAIGCVLFALFSLLAPHRYVLILTTLLALVLAISYIPKNQMSGFYVFSVFVSLSLASIPPITVSVYKVVYVIIGVLLAIIANQVLLPSVSGEACANDTVY